MEILILCIGALVATVAAWMYLNVQRPSTFDLEQDEEEKDPALEGADPQESEEAVLPAQAPADEPVSLFAKPSKGRFAFLLLMLAVLCGMAVALETTYQTNTLVANGKLLVLLAILFVAANVDARHRIIPNPLVLLGLVLRVVFWILELVTVPDSFWTIMKNDLIACLIVVAFFIVGVLLFKGGIGMGDIKLMLVMCLFQGFYGVVSSLFCSLFAAFIYAIIVLLLKRKTKKDSMPFAPAILLGTILSVFLTGM